jgi:hypothetical protein
MKANWILAVMLLSLTSCSPSVTKQQPPVTTELGGVAPESAPKAVELDTTDDTVELAEETRPPEAEAVSDDSHAGWGDISFTFKYDGPTPVAPKVNVTKDVAVCGKHGLVDESLIVNSENSGIRDVICFLYLGRGDPLPAIHPSYEKTADATVKLDNLHCRFEPHFQILRTTQTLLVGNPDPVGHNTNVTAMSNPTSNVLIPAGGNLEMNFPNAERLPAQVVCNIHPWMSARLMILNHPYGAVSDSNGVLTIKNLPAGKRTFRFWHERIGYVGHKVEVEFGGAKQKWKSGRKELVINSGDHDFGDVILSANAFK